MVLADQSQNMLCLIGSLKSGYILLYLGRAGEFQIGKPSDASDRCFQNPTSSMLILAVGDSHVEHLIDYLAEICLQDRAGEQDLWTLEISLAKFPVSAKECSMQRSSNPWP